MKITIDLPDNDADAIDLLERIVKEGKYNWDDAKKMVSLFIAIGESETLFNALSVIPDAEKHVDEPKEGDFIKRCVKNRYIQSIAENTRFSAHECEKAQINRAFHANGKVPLGDGAIKAIHASIRKATGTVRSRVSYFKKTALTREFAGEYPSVNVDALVYLYLTGKLRSTKEDYEILRNFLELMIREPNKEES